MVRTIQLTNHSAIKHVSTIWLPDMSVNRIPTVLAFWRAQSCLYRKSYQASNPLQLAKFSELQIDPNVERSKRLALAAEPEKTGTNSINLVYGV